MGIIQWLENGYKNMYLGNIVIEQVIRQYNWMVYKHYIMIHELSATVQSFVTMTKKYYRTLMF